MRRDQRGLLGISLAANLALLAVLGLAAYEGGAVILARLKVQDVAETAATEGAQVFRDTKSEGSANAAVEAEVADRDPKAIIERFAVLADGSVTVKLRRRPNILIIHRIGFLKGFAIARGSATAAPPRGL